MIESILLGFAIFILHKRFAFSSSSLCIGLIHIKTKRFNDPLDEALLSHVYVAGGFIAMLEFLFQLYFFGTKTFPKLVDVFFFGAPE